MFGNFKRARVGRAFAAHNGGNTVMIFGLSLVPVMLTLGAASDYARYTITRSALQQAADSAALTVASKLTSTTTQEQARAQAQVVLRSQQRLAGASISSATLSQDKKRFCITAQMTIKNAFMQIANMSTVTPSATTCADTSGSESDQTTFEIALVVDNSGSMSSSAGGVSKMQALKNSATEFVNSMYSKSPNVKMSITPFAAGVKVLDGSNANSRNMAWIDKQGNNSQHWIVFGGKTAANAQGFNSRFDIYDKLKAIKSSWDWAGCLESPKYPLNVNDTTPNPSDPETLFVPYLAPDEPDEDYSNDYLDDNGGTSSGGSKKKKKKGAPATTACSDSPDTEWEQLTHVCKYKATASDGNGSPHSHCPTASSQTLLPLETQKNVVTTKIASLDEGGNTNLHEGFMWGWRTLSPNLPFGGGRSYNAPKNRKIMIFMTDGYNNWAAQTSTATGSTYQAAGYYSYNGEKNLRFPDGSTGNGVNYQDQLKTANDTSSNYWSRSRAMQDELTAQACANAKQAGIEVFTIGFSTPSDQIDAQGLALLRNCATNADHYFKAEDATQLGDAFASVSAGLGKLRLTQ